MTRRRRAVLVFTLGMSATFAIAMLAGLAWGFILPVDVASAAALFTGMVIGGLGTNLVLLRARGVWDGWWRW